MLLAWPPLPEREKTYVGGSSLHPGEVPRWDPGHLREMERGRPDCEHLWVLSSRRRGGGRFLVVSPTWACSLGPAATSH